MHYKPTVDLQGNPSDMRLLEGSDDWHESAGLWSLEVLQVEEHRGVWHGQNGHRTDFFFAVE